MHANQPALLAGNRGHRYDPPVLDRHPSIVAEDYKIDAQGRDMDLLGGLYRMHPAFDPIALDRRNEWLESELATCYLGKLWQGP